MWGPEQNENPKSLLQILLRVKNFKAPTAGHEPNGEPHSVLSPIELCKCHVHKANPAGGLKYNIQIGIKYRCSIALLHSFSKIYPGSLLIQENK